MINYPHGIIKKRSNKPQYIVYPYVVEWFNLLCSANAIRGFSMMVNSQKRDNAKFISNIMTIYDLSSTPKSTHGDGMTPI